MKWLKNKLGAQRSASTYSVDSDLDGNPAGETQFQIYNHKPGAAQPRHLMDDFNRVQSANYELKEMNGATRRAMNFERFNQEFREEEAL